MANYELEQEHTAIVHTCNCPYSELAATHRELCHLDAFLIGNLTSAEVQPIAHIAEGGNRCSYRVVCRNETEGLTLVSAPTAEPLHA